MKRLIIGSIFLFAMWFIFQYCLNNYYWNRDTPIGKYKAGDYIIEIYQEQDFDWATTITYQIKNIDGTILYPKCFLVGTTEEEERNSFIVNIKHNVILIRTSDSDKILALFDTKTKYVYPNCELNIIDDFTKRDSILNNLNGI